MTPKFRKPFQPTDLDRPTRNDGGSAFPKYFGGNRAAAPGEEAGMSLRDFFAAIAMAGQASYQGTHPKQVEDAYAIADALLKERAKP